MRERKRREHAADPEKRHQRDRDAYQARRADPEWMERRHEQSLAWSRLPAAVERKRQRYEEQKALDPEPERRRKRELQRRRRASSQALREQERDRAREYMRERRAADPDAMRETLRAWLQRADRPCRYARAGCTEFAKVGRRACQRHSTSDVNRSAARKRARTKRRLAERQGWLCTWCTGQLAADLARTEIDHLIPKSSGVVIEDDWNLQALHEPCNRSKGGKITPRALDLAAAHRITIAGIAA